MNLSLQQLFFYLFFLAGAVARYVVSGDCRSDQIRVDERTWKF